MVLGKISEFFNRWSRPKRHVLDFNLNMSRLVVQGIPVKLLSLDHVAPLPAGLAEVLDEETTGHMIFAEPPTVPCIPKREKKELIELEPNGAYGIYPETATEHARIHEETGVPMRGREIREKSLNQLLAEYFTEREKLGEIYHYYRNRRPITIGQPSVRMELRKNKLKLKERMEKGEIHPIEPETLERHDVIHRSFVRLRSFFMAAEILNYLKCYHGERPIAVVVGHAHGEDVEKFLKSPKLFKKFGRLAARRTKLLTPDAKRTLDRFKELGFQNEDKND